MLLELSEILACPECGPPQVMVAVVHEALGHRVTRGFLGCPACDSRFSIEEGAVHLVRQESRDSRAASMTPTVPVPEEAAMLAGAVLDLARGSGHLLVAPELATIVDAVAALAERWEVVSLGAIPSNHGGQSVNVSRIVVPDGETAPVLAGRCRAAVLAGDPSSHRIREFARALGPLGRLAIIAPGSGAVAAMREAGLEVIASDKRVAVALRRS